MVYNFFNKKATSLADKSASGGATKSIPRQKLAKELADEAHQQIIRKFKKRKVYSPFRDNICGC